MEEKLVFNGIDGSTGEYLLPPQTPVDFWNTAVRQTRWVSKHAENLTTLSRRIQAQAGKPGPTETTGISAEDDLERFDEPSAPGEAGTLLRESAPRTGETPRRPLAMGLSGTGMETGQQADRGGQSGLSNQPGSLGLERLVSWRDPTKLAESGWGLILPQTAPPRQVEMILDAFKPLLDLRHSQAGDLFRIFYNPEVNLAGWKFYPGYQPGDSPDRFLSRLGAGGRGPANPALGVPYYLLIVADPQSIPFEFQFALDTQYAVGRIYFDHLADYARYAASVTAAETDPTVRLARQAAFFGPANPNDQATALSAEHLIKPLAAHVTDVSSLTGAAWQPLVLSPQESTKTNLASLLSGGSDKPAFLFSASHGMGWPDGDPRQFASQGALLCQDWPGPGSGLVQEDAYFSARDVPSDANLLGMLVFNFACYGAGTPQRDHFSRGGYTRQLAPRPFMAALPQRLLSLERGGALAVIGHVERAWGYSFQWPEVGVQTEAFKSVLYSLMRGDPVGKAMEDMNERYTQIAAELNEALQNNEQDTRRLAFLWTANNDARGYALTGDPAVRLPQTGAPPARPQIAAVELRGELPSVLAPQAETTPQPGGQSFSSLPTPPSQAPVGGGGAALGAAPLAASRRPYTLLDGLRAMEEMSGGDSFGSYDSGDDVRGAVQQLRSVFTSLTDRLSKLTAELTTLEVKTYTVSGLQNGDPKLDEKLREKAPELGARLHACTHIKLDGSVELFLPDDPQPEDLQLLPLHSSLTGEAMANRAAFVKAIVDALAGLISPK